MLIQSEVWKLDLIETHVWLSVSESYGVVTELTAGLDGDFTLIGWFTGIDYFEFPFKLWDIGSLEVRLDYNSDYELVVTDANGSDSDVMAWDESGWNSLVIVRDGSDILVYFNSKLAFTYASGSVLDYGDQLRMLSATCSVFDLRVVPRAQSADDITYYYNNVIENQGDAVLPDF